MAENKITVSLKLKWFWRIMMPAWYFQVLVLKSKPMVPKWLYTVKING